MYYSGYSLNYVITRIPNYLTTPRCPFGRRIHVDDVYCGKRIQHSDVDCVTDESYTRGEIKEKCDGKFICDPFYINNIYISCPRIRSWDISTDFVVIQYHCIVSDNCKCSFFRILLFQLFKFTKYHPNPIINHIIIV